MSRWFAFNGDADGLCALQQLRLAEGAEGRLVTGVKRDIRLLERVEAGAGDAVTVLDVSLDGNRAGVRRLLDAGAAVRWFDHHYAGELPGEARFEAHIDTGAEVCTSLLVDRHLGGRHHAWAVAAAFGDGLAGVGARLAAAAGFDAAATAALSELGVLLNYNAYGETLADLHFDPLVLAARMLPYRDPLDFFRAAEAVARLREGYAEDMAKARAVQPERQVAGATVLRLPDAAWARRVIGVLANELMQARPEDAIAILAAKRGGGYAVSLRVPADCPIAADEFCREFETGGGRKRAAGINHLPADEAVAFAARFEARFRR